MFYVSADIKIISELNIEETAKEIEQYLEIPSFVKDTSGRWEEEEVYISRCFGLEFTFGTLQGERLNEYGISIDSYVEGLFYDGTEKEVDATKYCIWLLSRVKNIQVIPL